MNAVLPDGRVALITGAARGIGRALAVGFAEAGADVVVTDLQRQQAQLNETCDLIRAVGAKAYSVAGDVSNKAEVDRMVAEAMAMAGQIDILVNNAGILTPAMLQDVTEDLWDSHMAVNAKGTLLVTQAVLPDMQARKSGRIINIASLAGRQGIPTQGHYAAAKAAVITLTRVFAQEVGEDGINVNAICPGIILTEMGKNNLGTDEMVKQWENSTSLRRLGQPEDVVGPALFLASEQSEFVTGQALNVCGGLYFD